MNIQKKKQLTVPYHSDESKHNDIHSFNTFLEGIYISKSFQTRLC